MKVIYHIVSDFLTKFFWDFRGLPYSYESYKMMSHPQDSEKYLAAVEKLRNGSKSETFTLHTGEEVTIS